MMADNILQMEEEDRNELLPMNQAGQIASEKQMTAEVSFSEGLQDKLPRNSPSHTHSSGFESREYPDLQLSTNLLQQIYIVSAQPKHRGRHCCLEYRAGCLTSTLHQDIDGAHTVIHRSGEMTDDPLSSHDSCQKLSTTWPQGIAVIPSDTDAQCPENSDMSLQGCSTRQKQTKQTIPSKPEASVCQIITQATNTPGMSDSNTFSHPSDCINISHQWLQSHDLPEPSYFSSSVRPAMYHNVPSQQNCVSSDHYYFMKGGNCTCPVFSSKTGGELEEGRPPWAWMGSPCLQSSAEPLPGPSTREEQKDQAVTKKLAQPAASMFLLEKSLQFLGGSCDFLREGTEVSYLPPYGRSSQKSQKTSAEITTQAPNLSDMPSNYSVIYIDTDSSESDCGTYQHYKMKLAVEPKRHPRSRSYRKRKAYRSLAPTSDAPECLFDQPQPYTLTEIGMIHNPSCADGTPGPMDATRACHDADSVALYDSPEHELFLNYDKHYERSNFLLGGISNHTNRMDTGNDDPSIYTSVFTAESGENMLELLTARSESEPGSDAQMEMEGSLTARYCTGTANLPTHSHLHIPSDPGWSRRGSSSLTNSHSIPSLSLITSAQNKTCRRAKSLPVMRLKSSFKDFTPDITVDENNETYWFQCSCPGLYQCSVTGLVFHIEGEGEVVYRTVPWNRRLLAQHHKKPAGPLFDIKCLQSVCQLYLPHCEIHSTGGCQFLSVAHVNEEGMEFITPHKITETHVIINITGFSGFGNVKDEDSPPDPVQALVLLFYRPWSDPELTSLLNVLLLPKNVVLQHVLHTRKKLVGDERYIETSPHCKLHPKQEYTLSTCPGDDSVLVQPTEAEFDCDNYDNYFPSFQVNWETTLKHIKVFLRDTNKHSVWERRVCLSSTGVKRSCGPILLNLPPNERLLDVRSSFIDGISGPVLQSLLDKLFDKKVMTESERESADEMQNKRDKARFVIDTVRRKGEAASSEMIAFLCEVDPFLCEHLGLI